MGAAGGQGVGGAGPALGAAAAAQALCCILASGGPSAPHRFAVKRGDRVAQLILERIVTPEVCLEGRCLCVSALLLAALGSIPHKGTHACPAPALPPHTQVLEVDSLDDTQRGAGGYGSTGVGSH